MKGDLKESLELSAYAFILVEESDASSVITHLDSMKCFGCQNMIV